jgi:hypothetical protein
VSLFVVSIIIIGQFAHDDADDGTTWVIRFLETTKKFQNYIDFLSSMRNLWRTLEWWEKLEIQLW